MTRTMIPLFASGCLALGAAPVAAQQAAMPPFEEMVYITCAEAQAMEPERRIEIARYLADHAAAQHGISLPATEEAGHELGILVRGGCTMFPQAYLFGVIGQAVRVEAERAGAMR